MKEQVRDIETRLNVTVEYSRFSYKGVTFGVHPRLSDGVHPITLYSIESHLRFRKGFKSVDDLCAYLEKNIEKLIKRRDDKEANYDKDTRLYFEIVEALGRCPVDRHMYFDGQNLQVATGKSPELVQLILDTVLAYDKEIPHASPS